MPNKQHYISLIICNLQNLKVFELDILLGIRTTIPQNQFNSDCQIKKRVLRQLNWVTENV